MLICFLHSTASREVMYMQTIEQRLDQVRALLADKDFLTGKGLSNEVNIRIFPYNPKDEMAVRHFMEQILSDTTMPCRIIHRDLYQIFLEICEDIGILDAIPEMEAEDGSSYLLEQIHDAIGDSEFVAKIDYPDHAQGDVVLLSGVGEVFPFMRIHALLEALQPCFTGIPIVVLYPGDYDGHHVKLFGKLPPNDYYRAFSIV